MHHDKSLLHPNFQTILSYCESNKTQNFVFMYSLDLCYYFPCDSWKLMRCTFFIKREIIPYEEGCMMFVSRLGGTLYKNAFRHFQTPIK